MVECNCEIIFSQNANVVTIIVPGGWEDAVLTLKQDLAKKKVNQAYVKLGYPRKPRTTGKRSDNTHIHGHASEIAQCVGESKNKIIMDAIDIAMGMMGREFPTHIDYKGDVIPDAEPDWDTRTAHYVIEGLHKIASMIPCKLTEYEEK